MLIPRRLCTPVSCRVNRGLRLKVAAIMRDQQDNITAGTVIAILDKQFMRRHFVCDARQPLSAKRFRPRCLRRPRQAPRRCDQLGCAAPQRRLDAMNCIGIFQATREDCFSLSGVAPAQMTDEPLPLTLFNDGPVGGARVACSRVDVQHHWHRRGLRRRSSPPTDVRRFHHRPYLLKPARCQQHIRPRQQPTLTEAFVKD
jgi:hypothetical protein